LYVPVSQKSARVDEVSGEKSLDKEDSGRYFMCPAAGDSADSQEDLPAACTRIILGIGGVPRISLGIGGVSLAHATGCRTQIVCA
jgi:hypothetical protein